MAIRYGFPYSGSKSRIARSIIDFIVEHQHLDNNFLFDDGLMANFYDLFAGGAAITCAASEEYSSSFSKVVYNDIDPEIYNLFVDTQIERSYIQEIINPQWICYDKFNQIKKREIDMPDAIRSFYLLLWSFGYARQQWAFPKDKPEAYKAFFDVIVNKDFDLAYNYPDVFSEKFLRFQEIFDKMPSYYDRFLYWRKCTRNTSSLTDYTRILSAMKRFSDMPILTNVEWHNLDYAEVPLEAPAIIYCDPPYSGADVRGYRYELDPERFWDWVRSCPYPVYVSSYGIAPEDFPVIKKISFTRNMTPEREQIFELIHWNGKML
jgi:site-specific DNA-adenine methylase